ncbi:MAG: hypothetical protein ABSG97_04115 [Sedimentisphaerales bacterium]|jgi:hypothetical protein
MPKIAEKLDFLIKGTVEIYKKCPSAAFLRPRGWVWAELAIKFVKNASDYYNSDEEFDIIVALEGLVA